MHRTVRYLIKEGNQMHAYCETVCRQFKNMYNVSNFYIRQCMTGMKKEPRLLSDNEKEVISIVNDSIARNNVSLNKKTGKPKKQFSFPSGKNWFLGYEQLNAVFSVSKNVDYKATHSHMAQKSIKKCVNAWLSFFALNKDFKNDPSKYKGKCSIPKYIKGDMTTAELTNMSFSVKRDADGRRYVSFAKVDMGGEKKEGAVFYIGNYIDTDKFEKVEIKPYYGSFLLLITYEDPSISEISGKAELSVDDFDSNKKEAFPDAEVKDKDNKNIKVMGIDLGVRNFITIADNIGSESIIVRGGFLKTRNQYFNKYYALVKSKLGKKGTNPDDKPALQKKLDVLSENRDNFFRDCFYKVAHHVCRTAKERGVGIIVVGKNKFWKDSMHMYKKDSQNFVCIPFSQFIHTLRVTAYKYSIRVLEIDESYTSKSSFPDMDYIPTYGKKNHAGCRFSGRRRHTGLYVTKRGITLNADVNGALNIIRKAFGDGIFHSPKACCDADIKVLGFQDFYPASKKDKQKLNVVPV